MYYLAVTQEVAVMCYEQLLWTEYWLANSPDYTADRRLPITRYNDMHINYRMENLDLVLLCLL